MDWLPLTTGIIGTITGIGGLLTAQRANRAAQHANRIAERAVQEAEAANRIAIQANQLAEDANTISNRAIDMSSEGFDYQWGFHVNNDGTMWISHDSTHEAFDLTLFVEVQRSGKPINPLFNDHRYEDEVSPGAQLFFDVHRLYPELTSETLAQPGKVSAMFDREIIYNGRKPVKFDVVATLKFKTPGGRQLNNVIKHSVSCRQNKAGRIEFKMLA